jgi:hypothetical protein
MTPNQVVAYRLRWARERIKDWTQEQTAEHLEPYLGIRWSSASFSTAESTKGKRVREFTADEIVAFSKVFELPVGWFFLPPNSREKVEVADERLSAGEVLRVILGGGREHYERAIDDLLKGLSEPQRRRVEEESSPWSEDLPDVETLEQAQDVLAEATDALHRMRNALREQRTLRRAYEEDKR